MNPAARAWTERAEAHGATARREHQATEDPNPAAVVYACHFCVQAYLRARLLEAEVPFPATPHLVVLLYLCMDLEPSWEEFRERLRRLTFHYMETRDATQPVPPDRVREALDICAAFRSAGRKSLGI
ncbi:MAG: HEPN domain-containing protein [Acidobacteria bacterium]|nr:HEPN domain-containing protein [Acidobacteriota bacterium]